MMPAVVVLCAWLLFGGTHVLLSSPPLRDVLARRLGERVFVAVYALIASVSLALLAAAVARFGSDGAPGLRLAAVPAARWALGAVALLGAALAIAGLVNYMRSPMAVLARKQHETVVLRPPAGVERITRHPFFVGLALLMGAHALLASTLAGAVFFAGFAALALAGIPMQDRKLRAKHGGVYDAYLAATSALPFAAARASSDAGKESSLLLIVISIAGAVLLAALHPLWRLGHGAPFAVLTLVGGLYAVARQMRSRRPR